eukprot:TRINITY_DN3991_c0_g1_i4.p1 TRINITY_DN3991_c0_g1~~TRINITY_DN3991_c0_g1_i4.p1  ORF type:complete len:611 (-),score=94.19 TRINITY_DN3991_c0_g1_i4:196-1881(-)
MKRKDLDRSPSPTPKETKIESSTHDATKNNSTAPHTPTHSSPTNPRPQQIQPQMNSPITTTINQQESDQQIIEEHQISCNQGQDEIVGKQNEVGKDEKEKGDLEQKDIQDKNSTENVEIGVMATAKEEAAARAARIRLGYEQPSTEDLTKVGKVEQKLPGGEEPSKNLDFHYIASGELTPLDDPQKKSEEIVELLTTTNWVEICDNINSFRSLIVFNKDCITDEILAAVIPKLIKYIRNPRSSVCKTAIISVIDLVANLKDEFLPFLDTDGQKQTANSVLYTLLTKASANDKRFVIEATLEALDATVMYITPQKLLGIILPYATHKNPKVRGQACRVLSKCLQELTNEYLINNELEKILKICANLVCDKTPEARENARQCILRLKEAYKIQEVKNILEVLEQRQTLEQPQNEHENSPIDNNNLINEQQQEQVQLEKDKNEQIVPQEVDDEKENSPTRNNQGQGQGQKQVQVQGKLSEEQFHEDREIQEKLVNNNILNNEGNIEQEKLVNNNILNNEGNIEQEGQENKKQQIIQENVDSLSWEQFCRANVDSSVLQAVLRVV